MNNIFISSIDNNGGKTVISAGIAAVMQSLSYKAGVYKPIETKASDKGKYLISPDLTFVKMLDPYITTHSTYMLTGNIIPALGNKLQKVDIDFDVIKNDYTVLSKKTDVLMIESTGGLMTPINNDMFTYHIPKILNIPVLFIVNPSNSSLNNYLNEINTAKTLGINILGVIINKYQVYSESPEIKYFPKLIEDYSDVKILGLIRNFRGKTVKANILINEILNGIDLEEVFKMKIPKLNGI